MRFPDCFNVIVVQEAPHVILDGTDWVTSGPSPPSCAAWRHSQGQSARKETDLHHCWITGGAAVHWLCMVRQWLSALCVSGQCLDRSQGCRHPTHMSRPTHSVAVATALRGGEGGGGGAFTYCCCWHSLEKVTRCYGDNPSQLSLFIINTFLYEITWEEYLSVFWGNDTVKIYPLCKVGNPALVNQYQLQYWYVDIENHTQASVHVNNSKMSYQPFVSKNGLFWKKKNSEGCN